MAPLLHLLLPGWCRPARGRGSQPWGSRARPRPVSSTRRAWSLLGRLAGSPPDGPSTAAQEEPRDSGTRGLLDSRRASLPSPSVTSCPSSGSCPGGSAHPARGAHVTLALSVLAAPVGGQSPSSAVPRPPPPRPASTPEGLCGPLQPRALLHARQGRSCSLSASSPPPLTPQASPGAGDSPLTHPPSAPRAASSRAHSQASLHLLQLVGPRAGLCPPSRSLVLGWRQAAPPPSCPEAVPASDLT